MTIPLKLLGIAKAIGRFVLGGVGWALEDWRHAAIVALGCLCAFQTIHRIPSLKREVSQADDALAAEKRAHRTTITSFEMATAEAERQAQANVERVRAEQTAITREVVDDYETRIADARRRAGELERMYVVAARSGARRAEAAGVSRPRTTTDGTDAPTGQDRLPSSDPGEPGELSLGDALLATEQAIQLDALITWVEQQTQVQNAAETQR